MHTADQHTSPLFIRYLDIRYLVRMMFLGTEIVEENSKCHLANANALVAVSQGYAGGKNFIQQNPYIYMNKG